MQRDVSRNIVLQFIFYAIYVVMIENLKISQNIFKKYIFLNLFWNVKIYLKKTNITKKLFKKIMDICLILKMIKNVHVTI